MSLRSLTEQEQKEAKEWFFEKYKDTPYYDDIFNIVSKIKRGELNKTSLKEYKKAVHIDFPNNEIMMEVFEDLLLAFPDEWDLLHKNSNKKSMIHNRKAQRRFMEWKKKENRGLTNWMWEHRDEDELLHKLSKKEDHKEYAKTLKEYEKDENDGKKMTWYKHQNGYVLCHKNLYIHQIITGCHGNGQGAT